MSLPDWLKEFADAELKKGGNPFDDIRELFKSKNDLEAVEARVEELRDRVGLNLIEKVATGYSGPIEKQTIENKNYRKVIFTGDHSQLVLMSIDGGQELGEETHDVDQFFRIEGGEADFILNGKKKNIKADEAIIVPAGTKHNVINSSDTEPLKLYTIYSPPEHEKNTVHKTKSDAEKKARMILQLSKFAQALEDEGMLKEAIMVDEQLDALMKDPLMAKDKEIKELPKKYEKFDGLDQFIQNACRTSGGHASIPAIQDRIRKEFDDEIDVKNKELEKYIRYCLNEHKDKISDDDNEHAGEYIAIMVVEDNDGNREVFNEPGSGTI